jgi:hypothetical protein
MSLTLLSICISGALNATPLEPIGSTSSLRSCTQRWETQVVLAQHTSSPWNETPVAAADPREQTAPVRQRKNAKKATRGASGAVAMPPPD